MLSPMLFNSLEFIFLFLPLTLWIFFQINSLVSRQWSIVWLVAASLGFYAWSYPPYLGLLLLSILFNYGIGLALSDRIPILLSKKGLLILGIALNLTLLGYFKYTNFFVSTVNDFLGTTFNLNTIILPLGISFFTFGQITYLVDSYRGETPDYNVLNYCFFVSFFPKIFAGPIVRYNELIPQLDNQSIYQFNPENIAVGLTLFSLGLFKKIVFADSIAAYVTPVFNGAVQGVPVAFFEAWGGALAYSLQLYFDFSGYSDMAIGVARMFGIKLPLNFDSPYKAVNIIDFWHRWHITLSNFLRDYLYIPLGGNRQGKVRRYINLMITMLLGGLWHGAGWTFVFWGGLHGLYLSINHQWRSFRKSLGHDLKKTHWWSQTLASFITFIAVVVSWVFFRAETINAAIAILKGMSGISGVNGVLIPSYLFPKLTVVMSFLLLIVGFTPNTQQWLIQYKPVFEEQIIETTSGLSNGSAKMWQWQPNQLFGFILGILLFLIAKTSLTASPSNFVYFNF